MTDVLLTSREKRLLRRLAKRKSDNEIAVEMGGTAKQIKDQRERLLKKLGLKSQAEIVEAAHALAPWPQAD